MTSVADVDAVAAVLRARGGDLTLLGMGEAPTVAALFENLSLHDPVAPTATTLFENLSLHDLVALAPLVPYDVSPVGCVALLRWVSGAHPDALVLVLEAMPVAAVFLEEENPVAFAMETHLQGAVAGVLRVLRDSLPAPREWGLPLREDLAPRLRLLSEWSVRVGFQEHINLWREWLQAQARPGAALHSVLAVAEAHIDWEWVVDTELVVHVMMAAWGDRDMCAAENVAEFAAFTTAALTLVSQATLHDNGGRLGCVAPKPLPPSQGWWLKDALPRMAELMTEVITTPDGGVMAGPLWQHWLTTMADSDAGSNLPNAWMHLCHTSMQVDPDVLRATARVATVAADLTAPGGPLDACAGEVVAHPLWWLHFLVSNDPASNRFGLAMNLLWEYAQPRALALMMENVITVLQWEHMLVHNRDAENMASKFAAELQRAPGGARVWGALLKATFSAGSSAGKPVDAHTLAFWFDEGDHY